MPISQQLEARSQQQVSSIQHLVALKYKAETIGKLPEIPLPLHHKPGLVAERLGRGLQNLVQRFESARDLNV